MITCDICKKELPDKDDGYHIKIKGCGMRAEYDACSMKCAAEIFEKLHDCWSKEVV